MIHTSNALLLCSSISVFLCFFVVLSISFDPTSKTSRRLGLVFRLMLCNMGLGVALIIYQIARLFMDSPRIGAFCNIFLPFPIFFFITSYGWTILIAFRFRSAKSWFLSEKNADVPFWAVWVAAFVLVFPTIISAILVPDTVSVVIAASNTNLCVYNHTTTLGKILDIVTFQAPLLFTILINGYSYMHGLLALRDSPHSVVARQMRRAGGYLFVLIIVWVPNIAYNFSSISSSTNSHFFGFLDFSICLAASQGALNVLFYVYSDPQMYGWVRKVLTCQKPWQSTHVRATDVGVVLKDSVRSNSSISFVNPIITSAQVGDEEDAVGVGEASMGEERSSLGDSMSSEAWARDSFSLDSTSALHAPVPSKLAAGARAGGGAGGGAGAGAGAGIGTGRATDTSGRDTSASTRPSTVPPLLNPRPTATKGILQSKGTKTWAVSNLDNEKFVRFGEPETVILPEEDRPSTVSVTSDLDRDSL